MFKSIRWRIAVPYSILFMLVLFGLGAYISRFVEQTYLNNLETSLLSQARLIGDNLKEKLNAQPQTILDDQARHWSELLAARVTIIATDGTVIGESHEDRLKMENHINRPEVVQAARQGEGSSIRFSQTVGYEMLYAAAPVTDDGKILGYVRVALPLREIHASIQRLQGAIFSVTLGAILISILLAALIAGQTTNPIRHLTRAATQIASGNLENKILPESRDEVGKLTKAFNAMATQLTTKIIDLERERSKIQTVLQEMTDGVLMVDANGRIMMINPAAEAMFAVNRTAALEGSLVEVIRQHQIVELWRKSQQTGQTEIGGFEIGVVRRYLQVIATPLGKALPGHTLLLVQDLTRLRQLETVRRDFLSNLSHELRTPLASLKILTETLQQVVTEDPSAAHEFLDSMETEVDALSLMVSELVELSQIESGRVPLKLQSISAYDLVEGATNRLRLQAERADLNLSVDLPAGLPPLLADPERLERVLVNLLLNAVKFTPAGGQIRVEAQMADPKKQPHAAPGMLVFSVQDTGTGIAPGDLPRIFERFYKSDRARASHGTGLGLAIARHLVEAHGGEIWAESQVDEGSTFYFTIPTAD